MGRRPSPETAHRPGAGRLKGPRRIRPASRGRRILVVIALLVGGLLAAVALDAGLLFSRLSRVSVTFPAAVDGSTWLIVGSDSRADVPPGPNLYGSKNLSPGRHADAVLIVHRGPSGTTILSVPRDILVSPAPGELSRLTLTFNSGPQQLVNGLCRSLHIPVDHLAVITMSGFVKAVDDVGGVTIDNPAPIEDRYSGLDLPKAGPVHLDGVQALALVRSRFPRVLGPNGWVSATTAAGDMDRTRWLGAVFHAFASKAHSDVHNPLALQALAWDLTGSLTLDSRTSLTSLLGINLSGAHVVDVPVRDLTATGIGATADPATYRVLAAAGFSQGCRT